MGRAAAAFTIKSTSERVVCCLFGCRYVPVVHVVVFGVSWRKQPNFYILIFSYIALSSLHEQVITRSRRSRRSRTRPRSSRGPALGVLRGAAAAELCEALLLVAAEGIDWRAPGRQLSTQPLQCGRARRLVCVLEDEAARLHQLDPYVAQIDTRLAGRLGWLQAHACTYLHMHMHMHMHMHRHMHTHMHMHMSRK